MTKAGAYEPLFKEINRQLENSGILVKKGALVDASIVDTPLKPKGKIPHKVTQDREDEHEVLIQKDYPNSVDKEASWIKKAGKVRYGFKKHYVTDQEGLVCRVVTTKASVNEITSLEEVLNSADLPEDIPLKADKGYQSKKNTELLKQKKLKKKRKRISH